MTDDPFNDVTWALVVETAFVRARRGIPGRLTYLRRRYLAAVLRRSRAAGAG